MDKPKRVWVYRVFGTTIARYRPLNGDDLKLVDHMDGEFIHRDVVLRAMAKADAECAAPIDVAYADYNEILDAELEKE